MNIIDAIHDANLFHPFFRDLASWSAWISALKAVFALPMDEAELEIYRRHTRRQAPPVRQVREGWFFVGRRGGKTRVSGLVAVFMACFRNYDGILAPGERGTVAVVASDRRQSRTVLRYIIAFLEGVPMLAALIERKTAEGIDLKNGITIEVHTCSFRSVRGYTVVAAVLDEVAYWRSDESANPDVEIANAIRPATASVPGALIVGITTLYAPRGLAWEMDQTYYGQEDPEVLVWRADTRSMNPTIPQSIIDRAFKEDEAAAWSEYGRDGEIRFRSDVESFISREAVQAVVVPGRIELPPCGFLYTGFVDLSGGAVDSSTLAISHEERDGKRVLDLAREVRPPFSPAAVVAEFAGTLKAYGCSEVVGDRYAGEWPREGFQAHGIFYRPAEKTKSELYVELLPAINSGRVALLDNDRLISQLSRLERRTARSGKDSIDHAPGGHDDLANAAAGAIYIARPLMVQTGPAQEFAETEWDVMNPLDGEEEEFDEQGNQQYAER